MKKATRVIAALICLLMVVAVFTACNNGAAPESKTEASAAPESKAEESKAEETAEVEPTAVTMWVGDWWGPEKEHIEKEFPEDCGEGWSVDVVLQPVNGYLDSAIAAVASGSGPDVLDLDTLMIPSAIDAGLCAPLNDFISRYGIVREDFVEACWDAGVTPDGNIYSIPNRFAPTAMAYNKDFFKAAGEEDLPDQMPIADFKELAKRLTKDGKYGYGIAAAKSDAANVMTSLVPFLWGEGGDFLNADMTASALNTPESVKGIKEWVEMYTVDKSVPDGCIDYTITRDLFPLFCTQDIAMCPLGDNNIATLVAGQEDGSIEKFEWEMKLLPGYGRNAGWSFTIPVGTEKVDAAEYFINYYVTPEVLSRNNTIFPAVKKAMEMGRWGDEMFAIYFDQMNYVKNCPASPKWTDIANVVIEELQNALTETITPEEACANMDERVNALLG